MLSDKPIIAFAPTVQPEKALAFYRDTLGLKLISQDQFAIVFDAHGIMLRISITQELKPQNFTILGWNVPDIKSIITSLNKKGIVFEKYSFLKQDPLGIWTSPAGAQIAWFKDPDGNLLSLT